VLGPLIENTTNQAALPLFVSLFPTHTSRACKREKGEIARGRNGVMVGNKSKGECQFLCFFGAS
jgi:hypothetical protein